VTTPWIDVEPLARDAHARLRRRAIFDCCKWDPQVGDVATVADRPLVLTAAAWTELATLTRQLAGEVLSAEEELSQRPELQGDLGLPRSVVSALGRGAGSRTPAIARLVRFDFHYTDSGWRISEANTDVPGGMNEASGLASLMTPYYDDTAIAGDAAGVYARALAGTSGSRPHVALAHATAYTDDRQVMTYLARRLSELGVRTSLISPAHLRWRDGCAYTETDWASERVDAIARFFPAEWLPNLPEACGWTRFFHDSSSPLSNPASAVLTQSKRFPLVWDSLRTKLPTWSRLLPETRDPRDAPWQSDDGWVLKPALGRVGEGVGMRDVVSPAEWRKIERDVRRAPRHWIAQRRFVPRPLVTRGAVLHPSVGVYAVDGCVAGAYGRLARRPLIDAQAMDTAVLVETPSPKPQVEAGLETRLEVVEGDSHR
jgi:glutathionylspermidine synthase